MYKIRDVEEVMWSIECEKVYAGYTHGELGYGYYEDDVEVRIEELDIVIRSGFAVNEKENNPEFGFYRIYGGGELIYEEAGSGLEVVLHNYLTAFEFKFKDAGDYDCQIMRRGEVICL